MSEKFEKLQLVWLALILALGLIFAVKIGTSSVSKDSITVTGSAYQIVKSDSGRLEIELNARKPDKQSAYNTVKNQLPMVMKYLKQKLLDKGIDITVRSPEYFYSKLGDLKVDLLQQATTDAKDRATAMLKATHNKPGKIQSVRMGVFQITPVDSTNVSDMGINDTTTVDKKVTAVANVVFRIK